MLVELMPLVIEQKTVLSPMPICILNNTSKNMPEINKTVPKTIETFKYLLMSTSFLINWDNIRNKPKRPKNIMSLPLDDPIKNRYVIGLMIGVNASVRKIKPANKINIIPISIVLLILINNTLIVNTLNK